MYFIAEGTYVKEKSLPVDLYNVPLLHHVAVHNVRVIVLPATGVIVLSRGRQLLR